MAADYPLPVPERWTRAVLRFRGTVLAFWLAILCIGVVAAIRTGPLLSNTFSVPGTDSDRARAILERSFGERPDGVFTVLFRAPPAARAELQHRLTLAARVVPTGHATKLQASGGVLWGEVDSTLDLQHAKRYTVPLRHALAGSPHAFVTGQPAIQHDLEPILSSDLRRGEAIALPIALLVLIVVFGLSLAVLVPFVFAACTITGTLALVYAAAHSRWSAT